MSLEKLSYRQHLGKTMHLAYPVMLSQLGHILVGIIDSIMVGRLGSEPLAASAFANSIFHVALMFGIGISYGITPLVAQADGEGDGSKIIRLLRHGLILCFASGLFLFAVLFAGKWALPYMNQPVEVVRLGIPYYLIVASSILPLMIHQSFKQFSEGLSITKQTMYITIGANVINVILNYLLIYGKLGAPELGLNGAGWATLISRICMAVAMFGFVFRSAKFEKFRSGFNLRKIQGVYFKPMLKIGLPSGTQFVFEVGAFSVASVMMGWLGTKTLAAHQIAISMVSLSYMTATGVSAATTVRVGNQIGKKDGLNLMRAGNSGFLISLLLMAAFALVFILFQNFIPTIYVEDREVINQAAVLLIVAGLFQLSDGVQVVGLGALRGMSDVRIPTLITLLAYWGLAIPISYVFGFVLDFGAQGVWYGLLTGLSVAALLLLFRFRLLAKRFSVNFSSHGAD